MVLRLFNVHLGVVDQSIDHVHVEGSFARPFSSDQNISTDSVTGLQQDPSWDDENLGSPLETKSLELHQELQCSSILICLMAHVFWPLHFGTLVVIPQGDGHNRKIMEI